MVCFFKQLDIIEDACFFFRKDASNVNKIEQIKAFMLSTPLDYNFTILNLGVYNIRETL